MKKLLFSLFVAVFVATNLFASDIEVDGIWYDFDETNLTASVTYKGRSYYSYSDDYIGSVVIPASISYNNRTYAVTTIGSCAFEGCRGLTSVTIANSVISIGDYAFEDCGGLTSVTIGNSVTTIGLDAFRYCSGLTSVTIPSSVTTIGYRAFSLVNNIAYSGTASGSPWGAKCINGYVEDDLVYSDATKTTLCGCSSAAIGAITIPSSVKTIKAATFLYCSDLTSVTIPNSVTTIGNEAFEYCSGLTSIIVPNSVTTIGGYAFKHVNNIVYSGIATGSPWGAKCVNGYVEGYLVYSDAPKTKLCSCSSAVTGEIVIPNSVTTIGEGAFESCTGLTSVTIGNSVTTIGNSAFSDCYGLTSVTIGNSVTMIGNSAFYHCSDLTSITIPNSVTTIGSSTFSNCSSLSSITIPNSITTIGEYAFGYCYGLTSMTCYATCPPTCGSYCFDWVDTSIPVYVPAQSVDAYKQAEEWKSFTNIQPIGAINVPTTADVVVTPEANQATFTWPANPSADGYSLEITKDGVVF
ncbi:MAG: leucine-rich repeat domain-containing protein, partial [Paludibacteraceae bacterium]|nr:leucine-rich repeat domain-containing protein [Paludibacteraceae bacterium]